jgi:NAD(P)-dependent dehydrogenase (short-subunit alcohol dehydrogenase family)
MPGSSVKIGSDKYRLVEESKRKSYRSPVLAIITGIGDLFKQPGEQVRLEDSDRLDGKKVLLTGASSGLGFATAIELARRGAHVIMAVRSGIPGKGEEVRKKSGSGLVDMVRLDLSDLDSLRDFVKGIKERYGTFDIMICNAAVVTNRSRKLPYGLDEMFTVNYFAKFMLANLCLEAGCLNFQGSEKPRIIIVASESHRNADRFDWENFGKYTSYGIKRSVSMYGYYKLLLLTFANEMSRRINPDGKISASVFALCPGPVNSNIAREAPRIFQPLLRLVFWIFFRSPRKACRPVIYLATSREMEGRTLDYLFLMQPTYMDNKATDPENGRRLWELSTQIRKNIWPEEPET